MLFSFLKKKEKNFVDLYSLSMWQTISSVRGGEIEINCRNRYFLKKNFNLFFSNFFFSFLKLINFFFFFFYLIFFHEKKNSISFNEVIHFLQNKKLKKQKFFSISNFYLENNKHLYLPNDKNKFFRIIMENWVRMVKKNFWTKKLLLIFFNTLSMSKHQALSKKKFEGYKKSISKLIRAFKFFNFFLKRDFNTNRKFLKNCLEKMKNYLKCFLVLEKLIKHQSFIISGKNLSKKNIYSKKSFFSDPKKVDLLNKVEQDLKNLRENLKCNDLSQKNKIIEILFKKINCPINVFLPKNVVIVHCGHLFSSTCIKDLITSRNRKCPLCGKTFGKEGVRSIFLN